MGKRVCVWECVRVKVSVCECVHEWKCVSVCPCSTSWNLNQALCPSLATRLICLNKPTSWAHRALLNHPVSLSLSQYISICNAGWIAPDEVILAAHTIWQNKWTKLYYSHPKICPSRFRLLLTPSCTLWVFFFAFLCFWLIPQLLCFSKNIFIEPQ